MPIYSADYARIIKGYLNMEHFIDWEFILGYAEKTNGPILELACGAGRVMMKIAENGFEIYGIDASRPMIEIGVRAVAKLPLKVRRRIHFIQGDMRCFSFRKKFPIIIIPFSSFWFNFMGRRENEAEQCLVAIIENLSPGGLFLIDTPCMYSYEIQWWKIMARNHNFAFKIENYRRSNNYLSGKDNEMLIGQKNP